MRLFRRRSVVASDVRMVGGARISPLDGILLGGEFLAVLERVNAVMARFYAGELGRHAAAEQLRDCTHEDDDGMVWTVGASSGQWYQRDLVTGLWVPATPPARLDLFEDADDGDIGEVTSDGDSAAGGWPEELEPFAHPLYDGEPHSRVDDIVDDDQLSSDADAVELRSDGTGADDASPTVDEPGPVDDLEAWLAQLQQPES